MFRLRRGGASRVGRIFRPGLELRWSWSEWGDATVKNVWTAYDGERDGSKPSPSPSRLQSVQFQKARPNCSSIKPPALMV
ncbi:hypothetical protein FALBO_17041, partial [Fusarium albosuccineum]